MCQKFLAFALIWYALDWLKNSRRFLKLLKVKPKVLRDLLARIPALDTNSMYLLRALIGPLDCFVLALRRWVENRIVKIITLTLLKLTTLTSLITRLQRTPLCCNCPSKVF